MRGVRPEDRRREPRFVVDWTAAARAGGRRLEGRLLNVSRSGAFLLLGEVLPDDVATVSVDLSLPGVPPVNFDGVLRWRARVGAIFGYGLEVAGDALVGLAERAGAAAGPAGG